MKKHLFLSSLALLLLVSCGTGGNSSSSQPEESSSQEPTSEVSTETTSSEEPTSEVSTETTSSEEQDSSSEETSSSFESQEEKQVDFLEFLKDGYAVKTTYKKDYGSGNPSIYLFKSYVGKDVVLGEKYNNKTWEEAESLNSAFEYVKGEDDLLYTASYKDLSGKVTFTKQQLVDPRTNEDDDCLWVDSGLDNSFAKLTMEDFYFADGAYNLDMSDLKTADDDYVDIVNGLAVQFYPLIDGYFTHYFIQQSVVSFKVNVDEEGKPTTFELDLGIDDDGWSQTAHSITGEFFDYGAEVVTKMEDAEAKYEEFDTMMAKLQNGNFEFMVRRSGEDWSGAAEDYAKATGKADGKTFEVNDILNNKVFGYTQVGEGKYQKYTVEGTTKTKSGTEVDGNLFEKLVPGFKFSSAFFVKDETISADSVSYNYVKPNLLDSSASMLIDQFTAFDLNYGYFTGIVNFTVTINKDCVRFYNYTSTYYTDVTFYNIGGVKTISTTFAE